VKTGESSRGIKVGNCLFVRVQARRRRACIFIGGGSLINKSWRRAGRELRQWRFEKRERHPSREPVGRPRKGRRAPQRGKRGLSSQSQKRIGERRKGVGLEVVRGVGGSLMGGEGGKRELSIEK